MSTNEIFSLRIVTADFYLEKPKVGLDPCYSEFRGREIKRVPVIRIFGSNPEGQKSCMHVHGVFPYLYIPYDSKDFESPDKAVYLISSSLDKAINITMGQGSSGSQHVFKIQLVKGIPFYGYHKNAHQYLKIYMFNPRFVKRAANLLQNGAILGKVFQPHESHVSYILQFFIDFNLYGMSYLHVPKEVLKFRRANEDEVIQYPVQKNQILDSSLVVKQSTCLLELDINSGFILNRFQLAVKTGSHANPGIEAIWQDERVRRDNLRKECEEIPVLDIQTPVERPDVHPTSSHDFYCTGLRNKLKTLEEQMNQTGDSTLQISITPAEKDGREKRRVFNLKKLIANAIYPEECSHQNERLINASFIVDHLSNSGNSTFLTQRQSSNTSSSNTFLDDTVVDEELVLSLSQPDYINQTLQQEDLDVLEVMQQLEQDTDEQIDLDSTLAPLSQNEMEDSRDEKDQTIKENRTTQDDSDTWNDFTLVMDDVDEMLLKLSQPAQCDIDAHSKLMQLDGADDVMLTPKKPKYQKPPSTPNTLRSPHHSITRAGTSPKTPRTPKSVIEKYAPLPFLVQRRSRKRNLLNEMKNSEESCEPNELQLSDDKPLVAQTRTLNKFSTKRTRKKPMELDKTHITCNLRTPRDKNQRRLKVYSSLDNPAPVHISDHNSDQMSSRQSLYNEALKSLKVRGNKCSAIGELKDNIKNTPKTALSKQSVTIKKKNRLTLRRSKTLQPDIEMGAAFRRYREPTNDFSRSKTTIDETVLLSNQSIEGLNENTGGDKLLNECNSPSKDVCRCDSRALGQHETKKFTIKIKRLDLVNIESNISESTASLTKSNLHIEQLTTENLALRFPANLTGSSSEKCEPTYSQPREVMLTQETIIKLESNNSLAMGTERRSMQTPPSTDKGADLECDSSDSLQNTPKKGTPHFGSVCKSMEPDISEQTSCSQRKVTLIRDHTSKLESNNLIDMGTSKQAGSSTNEESILRKSSPHSSRRASRRRVINLVVSQPKSVQDELEVSSNSNNILKGTSQSDSNIERLHATKVLRTKIKRLDLRNYTDVETLQPNNLEVKGLTAQKSTSCLKKSDLQLQVGEFNSSSEKLFSGFLDSSPQISKQTHSLPRDLISNKDHISTLESNNLIVLERPSNKTDSALTKNSPNAPQIVSKRSGLNFERTRKSAVPQLKNDQKELEESNTEANCALKISSHRESCIQSLHDTKNVRTKIRRLGLKNINDAMNVGSINLESERLLTQKSKSDKLICSDSKEDTLIQDHITKPESNIFAMSNQFPSTQPRLSVSKIPLSSTGSADILRNSTNKRLLKSQPTPKSTVAQLETPKSLSTHKEQSAELATSPQSKKLSRSPTAYQNSLPSTSKKVLLKTQTTPKTFKTSHLTVSYSTPSDLNRNKLGNFSTPRVLNEMTFCDSEIQDDNDLNILSFYEKSFFVDSPVFSDISISSPCHLAQQSPRPLPQDGNKSAIITPQAFPETYVEVEENCEKFQIPDAVHEQPFYSDHTDVSNKKEVGHTVLYIRSKSLSEMETFQSGIADVKGIAYRRLKLSDALGNSHRNDDVLREYLSTEKSVIIEPCKLPPTKHEAKVWLKAKEHLATKTDGCHALDAEVDSPIKIRRQKVVMLTENESGDSGEDIECSMRSVSLSPLTPVLKPKDENDLKAIPVSERSDGKSSIKRRKSSKARLSLSQKLKDIRVARILNKYSSETSMKPKDIADDDLRNSQGSSQSSDTINSDVVLAEVEKSSFVKNLHGSQGSFDDSFGLSIASLNNTYGFKINLENLQHAKADVEHNCLTSISLEVFVETRDNLLPNPQFDAISCIFYAIEDRSPGVNQLNKAVGFISICDKLDEVHFLGIDGDIEKQPVTTEMEALSKLLELCNRWDPDILIGYEIEMSSWGYIIERAKSLDLNIAPLLSRIPSQKVRDYMDEDREQFTDLDIEAKLCGRILLDVWRLMRSEIALTSYNFENVMYHILHRRCPRHTFKDLTTWYRNPQTKWIVFEYYLQRVKGTLELLEQVDLIGRTSEMAKLIGIQFYEVLSRGSQFRVESMMLRIAKPRNLVPLSPSVQQRAHMRAPEYLPLILEPQSRFYPDPVIVLDFQSLYPSMIMAYNYCFSTCLGRVEHLGESDPFEFGASHLRVKPKLLKKLLEKDLITVSPCGAVFIKRTVREGILPRMLSEILDTRQMVKQSMKLHKNSTALQRILHARQLALKLIANVTYGYTAANFSGRMPCVEVGDSVVAKGRETLERAIKFVDSHQEWNVKVVYGDTDSLFVVVPGRSRAEAFRIGAEIAEAISLENPQPVKLKLEKVYQPCILQTKKRYVGYMYETPDQKEPVYEAKGIETVRRDGCPAASKMLEKCLRILFETADVSQIKKYVCRQFIKLLSGKANIQDLIFAKEFRGLKGYRPTACVPALELTRKWIQADPRKIPRRGERVPFIVVNGPPGLPLIKLVRSPDDVLSDEGLKINAIYYITKAIIPPLNRCLLLIGADVNDWFANLPRKLLYTPIVAASNEATSACAIKKSTISQYFSSSRCIIDCGQQTKQIVCERCLEDAPKVVVTLKEKISKLQRGYCLTKAICQACCGRFHFTECCSLDCPVLYILETKRRDLNQIVHYQNIIETRFA